MYGDGSHRKSTMVDSVRWLMTCHVVFMTIGTGIKLASSICFPKGRYMRESVAILAVLAIVTGMSGLIVFSLDGSNYEDLIREEQTIVTETIEMPGNSFYISACGFVIFSFVYCLELYIKLRDLFKAKRLNDERKLLLKDEIKFVYGAAPFFLDATSSVDENGNKVNPFVETCHLDIFQVPVHNNHRRDTHVIYTWS